MVSQPTPFHIAGATPELQEIIDVHRGLFGGFTMTAGPAEGAPASGDSGQAQGADDGAGSGDSGQAQGADDGAASGEQATDDEQATARSIGTLPKWAQDVIVGLRQENGAARTNAKAQAAEEARAEVAKTIGKALGLVKDEDAKVDPAELQRQIEKEQAANRDQKAELLIWQHAAELKVDPQAVTDSRAFAQAISALDPSAADFAAKVKAAAQEAADKNPRLKADEQGSNPKAPNKAGTEFAGGKNGTKVQEYGSLQDAVAAQYGATR